MRPSLKNFQRKRRARHKRQMLFRTRCYHFLEAKTVSTKKSDVIQVRCHNIVIWFTKTRVEVSIFDGFSPKRKQGTQSSESFCIPWNVHNHKLWYYRQQLGSSEDDMVSFWLGSHRTTNTLLKKTNFLIGFCETYQKNTGKATHTHTPILGLNQQISNPIEMRKRDRLMA